MGPLGAGWAETQGWLFTLSWDVRTEGAPVLGSGAVPSDSTAREGSVRGGIRLIRAN